MDALRDHPLSRETIQRNRLKACFALQGITSGLVADQRLNELPGVWLCHYGFTAEIADYQRPEQTEGLEGKSELSKQVRLAGLFFMNFVSRCGEHGVWRRCDVSSS